MDKVGNLLNRGGATLPGDRCLLYFFFTIIDQMEIIASENGDSCHFTPRSGEVPEPCGKVSVGEVSSYRTKVR